MVYSLNAKYSKLEEIKTPLNKLDILLKDYLIQQTNYALLLTAGWGAGKTYYLKNHFFNCIDDTGYQPVLVSLFGIKSIDEIKDRIITELYPILKNKYLKTTKTILKTVVKSADVTKLFGHGIFASLIDEVSEGKKALQEQQKDYLELDKLLICFDDLERASPELLTNSEILGYINSMVENNNIKVIIVANEGILEDQKYLEVKEKTIGDTIHFNQDFNDAFLNILEGLEQPANYKSFLKDNQQIIHRFLSIDKNYEVGKVNYRTLTHFIARFSQVYQFLNTGLKIKDLKDLKEELLSNLLKFSLFVINEYKKGFFTFFDRKGFEEPGSIMVKRYVHIERNNPDSKSTRLIQIADAYYPNEDFNFYDSIYSYLTGGDFFDKDKFLIELKHEYHVVNENIHEAYKITRKLSGVNYFELSDQEYLESTRKIRRFALEGAYQLHDYITIFYLVLRHGNPLRINEEKFCRQLLIQIKKKRSSHVYNSLIDQHLNISKDSEFYKFNTKLKEVIIDINNRSHLRDEKNIAKRIEKELSSNYHLIHDELIAKINKPFGIASFKDVSFRKFFSVFCQADNAKKSKMLLLFRFIYDPRKGNNSVKDFVFVKGLRDVIQKKLSRHPSKNISGLLTADLLKAVSESIDEIRPYNPEM